MGDVTGKFEENVAPTSISKGLCSICKIRAKKSGKTLCEICADLMRSNEAVNGPDNIDKILAERRPLYGELGINQDGVGKVWQGILMHAFQRELPPIPGHVVALMLAAMKTCRAAVPAQYHQDNYDDIVGYQRIAQRLAPKE